jgi:hypothetical protein
VRDVVLVLVAALLLVAGCDDSATKVERDPTSATPCVSSSTPEDGVVTGSPPFVELSHIDVCFGETVAVSIREWSAVEPLEVFLLTEEQWELSAGELLGADLVKLGEVEVTGEPESFSFRLEPTFERESGEELEVSPGDELHVMVWEHYQRGGRGMGAGPLEVRH